MISAANNVTHVPSRSDAYSALTLVAGFLRTKKDKWCHHLLMKRFTTSLRSGERSYNNNLNADKK